MRCGPEGSAGPLLDLIRAGREAAAGQTTVCLAAQPAEQVFGALLWCGKLWASSSSSSSSICSAGAGALLLRIRVPEAQWLMSWCCE